MKKLFITANWKSNKTKQEALEWLKAFHDITSNKGFEPREIIICPPFTLLSDMQTWIESHQMQLSLGGQDVSQFDAGAYTGAVHAQQIKELATYVIIGHSERRNNFGETDALLAQKVEKALAAGLTPIYCIQDEHTIVPEGVTLVAYEPPTAIGTGNPDTPENAERVALEVTKKYPFVKNILYGGSVSAANIQSFVVMEHISGVLVGGASLDADTFSSLITSASV